MASPFYSVGELSELLRCSQKWLYQRLNKGEIPGAFRLGATWFIDKEVLIQSLKAKAQKPLPRKETTGHTSRHGL